MFRPLARLLVSPVVIALFDLLLLIPLVLAIFDVMKRIHLHDAQHANIEVITGIGVLMIGWGVVLEERKTLREMFGIVHEGDPVREENLDHSCHHFGLGQLVLGLLAEMFVEFVHLPDAIVNTSGIEASVLAAALLAVMTGAIFLLIHVVRLIGFASGSEIRHS
jgi:hypothetical protein